MNTSGFDRNGSFEISLQVRDKSGNPTGKTRYFRTDQPDKLATFFEQNTYRRVKTKKKIDKKEQITGEVAEQILEDLYTINQDEE